MRPWTRKATIRVRRRPSNDIRIRVLKRVGGGLLALLILVQLFYPGDRMPLFARVDGVDVSGWSKAEAAKRLDELAAKQAIAITLTSSDQKTASARPADIGLKVSNAKRLDDAGYPWYLRILPSSLLWFGMLQAEQPATYSINKDESASYLKTVVGDDCVIPAVDATIRMDGLYLKPVPSKAGGTCEQQDALKTLTAVRPVLNKPATVRIPVTPVAPIIGDDEAKRLADKLNKAADGGVRLDVAGKQQTVTQKDVLSWLTFKAAEDKLTFEVDPAKAGAYLAKNVTPAVAKPAGVTKVSTLDFTETSRADGVTGQTLAVPQTLANVTSVLNGDKKTATAVVAPVAPKVEYTRSYTKSSTGIAAQIRFYDEDNAGVFGVSFMEIGGQGMSARHNGDRQFVTASTYKLFVAFSTLKRVDAGQMKWDDGNISSGRDLAKCFDDMIVKSDNACAEALIKKIGAKDLNADIKSLGLGSTAFRSDNNVTTANDLANYLTQLEKGTMPLKPESRSRLLDAMKRNVYRQGVPAGASGQTADKVGFLWGLLHDAAIVYSPKGTYVLAVMTDGSSWGAIADLTRKIEALR